MSDVFLDNEKKIKYYFSILLKILRILDKFRLRKEKLYKELDNEWNALCNTLTKDKKHGFLSRILQKDGLRYELGEKLNGIRKDCENIRSVIHKQRNLIHTEMKIDENEELILSQIQEIPLFNRLNQQEKETLTYLIYNSKEKINELFQSFRKLEDEISDEEKKLDGFLEMLNEIEHSDLKKIQYLFRVSAPHPSQREQRLINNSYKVGDINSLRDECLGIIRELEDVKNYFFYASKYFGIDELERIKKEVYSQLKKEQSKLYYVSAYLRKQRELRSTLPIDRLIAVHLTKYFPTGGVIKTLGQNKIVTDAGNEIHLPRETLHFALNGPVSSHPYGNWSGCKYAILVPLRQIFDRVINITPNDTFIFGELVLPPGSEVLGRANDMAGKTAGHAQCIIIPDNENLDEAVKKRLREKGYIVMQIGHWSWDMPEYKDDVKGLLEFFKLTEEQIRSDWTRHFMQIAEQYEKQIGAHSRTIYYTLEKEYNHTLGRLEHAQEIKLSKEECEDMKRDINELIQKLKQEEKIFDTKEEREGYERIFKIFEDLQQRISHVEKYIKGSSKRLEHQAQANA